MKDITKRSFLSFVLIFFGSCIFLHAQTYSVFYPESSDVRSTLIESWFTQDMTIVRSQNTQILQNDLGEYFLVRAEEKNELMEIILAPLVRQTLEVQDYTSNEEMADASFVENASLTIETWPKDALGSWILYRDLQTGKNVRIRYYFMNDKDVYLDFYPGRDKSYVDLSIYGALPTHNAPVPVPFEYFYTASLSDIKKLTQNIVAWKYVSIFEHVYSDTLQMVTVIRRLLPSMQEAGMFTSDTSEYDFLKWIINGLIRPLTGGLLFDEPLYMPTVEQNFSIPERQNTHKSFDFVRNLAAAAISAGTSLPYTYKNSNADVKVEPFAVRMNSDGEKERINFVTDIGYQASVLKPILYLLTATENDVFYLGAVRELKESSAGGRNSEQYYYDNAVAFFSWFDSTGRFNVSVFENGAEFTFDQFLEKYKDSFVYLVRVNPSMNFFPEEPENSETEDTHTNAQ